MLLAGAVPAAAQDSYFPEALLTEERPCADFPDRTRPPLDAFLSDLFSDELRALDEPVLHVAPEGEVLRALWLSDATGGVLVRINDLSSAHPRLTALHFTQAYYNDGRGQVDRRVERELAGEEVEHVRNALAAAQLFTPPKSFCRFGLDGDFWVIEEVQGGSYHFVKQWSPVGGPVYEVGAVLLALVAGDDWAGENVAMARGE